MVVIFFSRFLWNKPFIMTHCCSNYAISIIKSIILVNARELEHSSEWVVSSSIWKKRYYFPGRGNVWPDLWVMFLCRHCSESYPNKILARGAVKLCVILTQWNLGTWCSDTVIVSYGKLKRPSIIINQKNMGPWCSDIIIVFWEFQMTDHRHQQKNWNQHVFWVWFGCILVLNDDSRFIV